MTGSLPTLHPTVFIALGRDAAVAILEVREHERETHGHVPPLHVFVDAATGERLGAPAVMDTGARPHVAIQRAHTMALDGAVEAAALHSHAYAIARGGSELVVVASFDDHGDLDAVLDALGDPAIARRFTWRLGIFESREAAAHAGEVGERAESVARVQRAALLAALDRAQTRVAGHEWHHAFHACVFVGAERERPRRDESELRVRDSSSGNDRDAGPPLVAPRAELAGFVHAYATTEFGPALRAALHPQPGPLRSQAWVSERRIDVERVIEERAEDFATGAARSLLAPCPESSDPLSAADDAPASHAGMLAFEALFGAAPEEIEAELRAYERALFDEITTVLARAAIAAPHGVLMRLESLLRRRIEAATDLRGGWYRMLRSGPPLARPATALAPLVAAPSPARSRPRVELREILVDHARSLIGSGLIVAAAFAIDAHLALAAAIGLAIVVGRRLAPELRLWARARRQNRGGTTRASVPGEDASAGDLRAIASAHAHEESALVARLVLGEDVRDAAIPREANDAAAHSRGTLAGARGLRGTIARLERTLLEIERLRSACPRGTPWHFRPDDGFEPVRHVSLEDLEAFVDGGHAVLLDRLRARGRALVAERIDVRTGRIREAWRDAGASAPLLDLLLEEATGAAPPTPQHGALTCLVCDDSWRDVDPSAPPPGRYLRIDAPGCRGRAQAVHVVRGESWRV